MPAVVPREIELKLDFDPADGPALVERLGKIAKGGSVERLVSVYFDTPNRALRDKGMSVRIRTMGDKRVQTVKARAGTSAGLFDRSEWETEVADGTLDLEAIADTPAGPLLRKRKGGLAPVFQTVVDRASWTVETKRTTIAIAVDTGKVVAGKLTSPLAEVEFELKRGRPADLFALLRKFETVAGLRSGVLAKSERGYALLDGKRPSAFKAEPVALTPGMTSADAFAAVMASCLRQVRLNEPLVIGTRAPEALHQTRVGMRRLRSALSLFDTMIADERLPGLKTRLQAVSRALGDARNFDVYLARGIGPEVARDPADPSLVAFRADMEARRTAAYDRLTGVLSGTPFRRLLLDLVEWVAVGPWRMDPDPVRTARRDRAVEATAADILEASRRRVKTKGKALDTLAPEDRHRVRIAAKKLRYAAEFFAGLAVRKKARARHATFVNTLEGLQEHLGALNDIQTGHEIAMDLATGPTPEGAVVFAAAHISGEADATLAHHLAIAMKAQRTLVATKRFWGRWSDQ